MTAFEGECLNHYSTWYVWECILSTVLSHTPEANELWKREMVISNYRNCRTRFSLHKHLKHIALTRTYGQHKMTSELGHTFSISYRAEFIPRLSVDSPHKVPALLFCYRCCCEQENVDEQIDDLSVICNAVTLLRCHWIRIILTWWFLYINQMASANYIDFKYWS